jgi:hypothetical protein
MFILFPSPSALGRIQFAYPLSILQKGNPQRLFTFLSLRRVFSLLLESFRPTDNSRDIVTHLLLCRQTFSILTVFVTSHTFSLLIYWAAYFFHINSHLPSSMSTPFPATEFLQNSFPFSYYGQSHCMLFKEQYNEIFCL